MAALRHRSPTRVRLLVRSRLIKLESLMTLLTVLIWRIIGVLKL